MVTEKKLSGDAENNTAVASASSNKFEAEKIVFSRVN